MAKTEATAEADESSVPKRRKPDVITGGKIVRIKQEGHSPPCLSFDGEPPKKGDRITFVLDNNVTYTGVVEDAVEADGNVLVEFTDGIKPVLKK